ncbi:MAG: Rrf2 family transcriptional regulator [Gemmataceae bacterium]|jgi:Rrf2 family protein|nr:Rrf2 family transcriptional regulator [Gemmataceae bacterium]
MTLLSRKTDYALLIMVYLVNHEGGGSAREIAKKYNLSPSFVANILKELCQKGFLNSQRGVRGGYRLNRSADQISLGELLESLEDGLKLTNCSHHPEETDTECAVENLCPIKGPLREIHRRILGVLRETTLAQIIQTGQGVSETFQPELTVLGRELVPTNE